MKTQPNFRAFSTFCFSAAAQRSMVGETITWLARTRDYILQFYACWFPTYFSHHDDANMKARHFWDWCFIKEDEDSKEAASLFDKAGHDRQKFQEWPLCHDSSVSTFQKRWVAVVPEPGEHPFEFGSAVLTIYIHTCKPILAHAAWQRTLLGSFKRFAAVGGSDGVLRGFG